MTGGNNHAKQILIDEALGLAKKLENGSAGDIEVIGRAVSKTIRMTTAMFENNFRTEEECDKKHAKMGSRKPSRIKLGPVEFEGQISAAVISHAVPVLCLLGVGFMIGKDLGWW